jgi:hypothetical protein
VLWSAVGLVALQFAFHSPFAALFPQARDVEYGKKLARLKQVAAAKPPDRPLVVALGSSVTAMSFCPAALPDRPGRPVCYNFAINSCGVVVQNLCLRRLLAEGLRPDVVLIEFGPYFLHRPNNLVNDGEFIPPGRTERADLAVLDRYRPKPGTLRSDLRERDVLPWWGYRNNLQQWLDPETVPKAKRTDHLWRHTDRWGWEVLPEMVAAPSSFYLHPGPTRFLREFWQKLTAAGPDPQMAAAYCELADLCAREGIRPVVVISPECSFFRASYDPDGAKRLAALVERLRSVLGVVIVDARDWLADPEFVEGLHATPAGAHTFTTRLDGEVLRRLFPPG